MTERAHVNKTSHSDGGGTRVAATETTAKGMILLSLNVTFSLSTQMYCPQKEPTFLDIEVFLKCVKVEGGTTGWWAVVWVFPDSLQFVTLKRLCLSIPVISHSVMNIAPSV